MRKTKRDVYKSRFDRTFDFDKDIDLADLRHLLGVKVKNDDERERFGHYVNNIASIILHSSKFCGYPDFVKHEIRLQGTYDVLVGGNNFDGNKYQSATAPFSYCYRIIYNKAGHVVMDYYKNRCVSFSQMTEDFQKNVSDKMLKEDTIYGHEDDEDVVQAPVLSNLIPPTDVMKHRIKNMVRSVLRRKLQMELNLV